MKIEIGDNLAEILIVIVVFALLMLGALSCTPLTGVEDFSGVQPMQPRMEYRGWHIEMSNCLGHTRPYYEIKWYIAASLGTYTGYWKAPDLIYIRSDNLQNEYLIKHEMAHYILQDATNYKEVIVCARS